MLAQCDAKDGLKDGILNDPRECHFNSDTLLCKQGDELTCLTAPQVRALKTLYHGGVDNEGKLIFPGLMPGDEADLWKSWIIQDGPGVSLYTQNYFRYMVFDDPSWNALTADTDAAVKAADAKTAQALNATDPDLSKFAARGGKLVMYHGWNDPAISPLNTINYYGQVQAKMGAAKTAEFCAAVYGSGDGALRGRTGRDVVRAVRAADGEGAEVWDLRRALESWEEHGTKPDAVIATKYDKAGKVEMDAAAVPISPGGEV